MKGDDGEYDQRMDLEKTAWFRRVLRTKLEEDRAECAEHLATHALRPEKFFLAKMLLRVSGRAMEWMTSLCKFDHSQVDADGNRLRVREMMHADSKVPAPLICPAKEINKLIDAEIHHESAPADGGTRVPDRVNIQSDDRKAAVVRDVRWLVAELITDTADRYCGGWASDGSVDKPHWVMLTMDGAGLTHEDNGVRFAMSPGSVQLMNQSTNCVKTFVFYRAAGAAEDYDTLNARCAHARTELCKIWRAGGLKVDGKFVHVKFMLTADKAGFCHLTGRRNQNYENFGIFCDCLGKDVYNLSHPALTHYGRVTYEVRVARSHTALWEACGECEPDDDWTVTCDCCNQVRAPRVRPARSPPTRTF